MLERLDEVCMQTAFGDTLKRDGRSPQGACDETECPESLAWAASFRCPVSAEMIREMLCCG